MRERFKMKSIYREEGESAKLNLISLLQTQFLVIELEHTS